MLRTPRRPVGAGIFHQLEPEQAVPQTLWGGAALGRAVVSRLRAIGRTAGRLRASPAVRSLHRLDRHEDQESVYRHVFEQAPVGMALLDSTLRITSVNEELMRMTGQRSSQLRGLPVAVLASPPYPVRLNLMARKALAGADPVEVEHRYPRADGVEGWARTSMRRIGTGDGEVAMVCAIEDFTSDQIALEEQRREAELDPLTGLLNRRGGDRRLRSALEKMAEAGPVAVILCDADGFKEVNDRYGHATGDELLSGIAGRLRTAIRSGDDVARIGGDEFIIVARVADEGEAAAIAQRSIATAAEPFGFRVAGGGAERVTLSAGVAVAYPGGPVEPGSVLAAADRALYAAKAEGGGRWKLAPGG